MRAAASPAAVQVAVKAREVQVAPAVEGEVVVLAEAGVAARGADWTGVVEAVAMVTAAMAMAAVVMEAAGLVAHACSSLRNQTRGSQRMLGLFACMSALVRGRHTFHARRVDRNQRRLPRGRAWQAATGRADARGDPRVEGGGDGAAWALQRLAEAFCRSVSCLDRENLFTHMQTKVPVLYRAPVFSTTIVVSWRKLPGLPHTRSQTRTLV